MLPNPTVAAFITPAGREPAQVVNKRVNIVGADTCNISSRPKEAGRASEVQLNRLEPCFATGSLLEFPLKLRVVPGGARSDGRMREPLATAAWLRGLQRGRRRRPWRLGCLHHAPLSYP
jgi:hypothetical protein